MIIDDSGGSEFDKNTMGIQWASISRPPESPMLMMIDRSID
jgi:hypothetical protein